MTRTIQDLVLESHAISVSKGWHEGDAAVRKGDAYDHNRIAALLMLITTEVAEACECVRDNQFHMFYEADTGKPEGLPSELADVVIRVADLCGALRIDLPNAIEEKLAYNRRRQHRHGGRAL